MTTSEDETSPAGEGMGRIDVAGLTHTGLIPTENQDHFLVATMRKSVEVGASNLDPARLAGRLGVAQAYLMVVADGVGGRAGGAAASSRAVETTLEYIARASGCFQGINVDEEAAFIEKMEEAVHDAHESLRREYGDSEWAPATTLTMVILVPPRAYLVHVGDTRAYYLRRGRLFQLTRDQTFGQYLVDTGAMTEDQAMASPMGRTLASAVGSGEVNPSVGLIDLEAGDTLLLCSDGLTKHVPNDEIARLLQAPRSASQECDDLVSAALAGGGTDNVTVVVARMA